MSVNLLIVDDEAEICSALSRHFTMLGYHTLTANDGQEALKCFTNRKIDVVLSDIAMPGMDGTELCRAVRKDFPMTRIVMMTGHVTLENALACLRRGADDCIFKPFVDFQELEEAVERSVRILQRWARVLSHLAEMKNS